GGVQVPGDGVAGRPVPVGLGADLERHADAVSDVVAGGAPPRPPPPPAPAGPPPPPGGPPSPPRPPPPPPPPAPHAPAPPPPPPPRARRAHEGAGGAGPIPHPAPGARGGVEERREGPGPATNRLDVEPTPEAVAIADPVRLAVEHEDPADPLRAHPDDRRPRA